MTCDGASAADAVNVKAGQVHDVVASRVRVPPIAPRSSLPPPTVASPNTRERHPHQPLRCVALPRAKEDGVAVEKFVGEVEIGEAQLMYVTHNLGTRDVIVSIVDLAGEQVGMDVQVTSEDVVAINGAPGRYRVVVVG
jgi:hypothetical protein